MITPLRIRHRWLAPSAFAIAIVSLVAALAQRPDEFVRRASDPAGAGAGAEDPAEPFGVEIDRHSPSAPGMGRLWVTPRSNIEGPDLLAYASTGDSASEPLPGDAILLGALSTSTPSSVDFEEGARSIILYSLGHGSVIATVDPQSGDVTFR